MFLKINPQVAAAEQERRHKLLPTYEPRLVMGRNPNNTVTLVNIYAGRVDPVPVHLSRVKFHKNVIPALYLAQKIELEMERLPPIFEDPPGSEDSDEDDV